MSRNMIMVEETANAEIIEAQDFYIEFLLKAFGGDHARLNEYLILTNNADAAAVASVLSPSSSAAPLESRTTTAGATPERLTMFGRIMQRIKISHIGVGLSFLAVLSAGALFCVYIDDKINNAMAQVCANAMEKMMINLDTRITKACADVDAKVTEARTDLNGRINSAVKTVCSVIDKKVDYALRKTVNHTDEVIEDAIRRVRSDVKSDIRRILENTRQSHVR